LAFLAGRRPRFGPAGGGAPRRGFFHFFQNFCVGLEGTPRGARKEWAEGSALRGLASRTVGEKVFTGCLGHRRIEKFDVAGPPPSGTAAE